MGLVNSPPPSGQDDAALLVLVQKGDEYAMASLFDRYSKVVYSVALRVLRDPASAEDVLQEVFMQIWHNPGVFVATRGSLGGWLAVVARNRSIDTLRRKRPTEQVEEMALASNYNLADEAERNSMMEKARGVIRLLPVEQRKTLEMAFFDGLTHSEIAEMTGDPLGTVKTRIRSALTSLRKGVSSMSEERRITSEELALFAMQLLSQEETAEVAAYLAQSAEARRELAEIQGDLAIYAHTVDVHSPPAQARERLMKQVARERKAIPIDRAATGETRAVEPEAPVRRGGTFADAVARSGTTNEVFGNGRGLGSGDSLTEDDQPKRSVASRVLPWVGWAVAAGLAVAAGDLYRERTVSRSTLTAQASQIDRLTADAAAARQVLDTMTDSSAMRVTLVTKGQTMPLPTGRATYVASKGSLIFLASNLEPLQPAKTYELWLIPAAEGSSPIPAGTFHPDERGNASVILPPLPKGVEAKAFGVTVEDEGGATTPTLPIILVGE